MTKTVSAKDMERVWTSATEQRGALTAHGPSVVLYDMPLEFERGEAHLQIVYRGDQIAGLVLLPGAPTVRFGQ